MCKNIRQFDMKYSMRFGDLLVALARVHNHHLPQEALGHISPIQATKKRPALHAGAYPVQIHKRDINHPGHGTYV